MSDSQSVLGAGEDEVASLSALQARLGAAIDDPDTAARDLSPLSRRYQEVSDRLREARALAADSLRSAAAAEAAADDRFDPDSDL